MCDVCKANKVNSLSLNGANKSEINTCTLYRVQSGKNTYVKLCFLHEIDLYLLGESRFLKSNLSLARALVKKISGD